MKMNKSAVIQGFHTLYDNQIPLRLKTTKAFKRYNLPVEKVDYSIYPSEANSIAFKVPKARITAWIYALHVLKTNLTTCHTKKITCEEKHLNHAGIELKQSELSKDNILLKIQQHYYYWPDEHSLPVALYVVHLFPTQATVMIQGKDYQSWADDWFVKARQSVSYFMNFEEGIEVNDSSNESASQTLEMSADIPSAQSTPLKVQNDSCSMDTEEAHSLGEVSNISLQVKERINVVRRSNEEFKNNVTQTMHSIKDIYAASNDNFANLEVKISKQFKVFDQKMDSHFQSVDDNLEKLISTQNKLEADIKRMENSNSDKIKNLNVVLQSVLTIVKENGTEIKKLNEVKQVIAENKEKSDGQHVKQSYSAGKIDVKNKDVIPKTSYNTVLTKSSEKDAGEDPKTTSKQEVSGKVVTKTPIVPDTLGLNNKFQAHATSIKSREDVRNFQKKLYADGEIKTATHNILAYRYMDNGKVEENCDEDGERGVGYRIINLMRSLKVCNIAVCISRWYSKHMGSQRFNDICMCATDAIVQLELPKFDEENLKNDNWQRPREKQFNRYEGTGNRTRRYGQRPTERYGKPQSFSRQWSTDEASDNYQRNSYTKRHGGDYNDHVTHRTGRQPNHNPQNNNSNTFSPEWLNSQNNADYQKNNYNNLCVITSLFIYFVLYFS